MRHEPFASAPIPEVEVECSASTFPSFTVRAAASHKNQRTGQRAETLEPPSTPMRRTRLRRVIGAFVR